MVHARPPAGVSTMAVRADLPGVGTTVSRSDSPKQRYWKSTPLVEVLAVTLNGTSSSLPGDSDQSLSSSLSRNGTGDASLDHFNRSLASIGPASRCISRRRGLPSLQTSTRTNHTSAERSQCGLRRVPWQKSALHSRSQNPSQSRSSGPGRIVVAFIAGPRLRARGQSGAARRNSDCCTHPRSATRSGSFGTRRRSRARVSKPVRGTPMCRT